MTAAPKPSPCHKVFCVYCLQNEAQIRLTKKGMPTLYCRACSTRTFFATAVAVRGYFSFTPAALDAYMRLHGREPLNLAPVYDQLKDTYGELADRAHLSS